MNEFMWMYMNLCVDAQTRDQTALKVIRKENLII